MNKNNIKVALLVANGFEQSEMVEPRKFLQKQGINVQLISPEDTVVKGWTENNWGDEFTIDIPLNEASPEDFNMLVLPGGVMNPDKLRMNEKAIAFVKHFITHQKPIAAICHGPWILINAGGVKDRKITSWPSIKQDLMNAGGMWVDEEAVLDSNGLLLTSRKPADLPAFNEKIMELLETVEA